MNSKNQTTAIEVIKSIYGIILGFVPGGHVLQELTDFRGKVQRERLNKFSEYLDEGFRNVTGKEFDSNNLKTEDFIDTFDIILNKVVHTKSEEKLKRYKNVLIKQMFEKNDSEMFMKYLSLIDDVNEPQVLILSNLYKSYQGGLIFSSLIKKLMRQESESTDLMINLLKKEDIKLSNGGILSHDELKFYLYDLKSKGLIDTGIKKETQHGTKNLSFEQETFFNSIIGNGFIDFIQEYGGESEI